MHSGEASYTPVLVSIPIAHTSNRKWTQEVFKKNHTKSRGKSSGREREGSVSEGLGGTFDKIHYMKCMHSMRLSGKIGNKTIFSRSLADRKHFYKHTLTCTHTYSHTERERERCCIRHYTLYSKIKEIKGKPAVNFYCLLKGANSSIFRMFISWNFHLQLLFSYPLSTIRRLKKEQGLFKGVIAGPQSLA